MAVGGTRRAALLAVLPMAGCTSVDPGSNFVVPDQTFDADYFYCHVEPELIFQKNCGPGDPSIDATNSCHFNSAAVSGMDLLNRTPVDCGGGDHPINAVQVAAGSAAASDLVAVSFEMNSDYTTAPLFVRPSGNNHPRAVFSRTDPLVIELLSTWASK
jgi:hypothetical protein